MIEEGKNCIGLKQEVVNSKQPATIKYTWTDADGKKQYLYKVEKICSCCGEKFFTRKLGKSTAEFCSKSCAAKVTNSKPEVRVKMDRNKKKPLLTGKCAECGKDFHLRGHGKADSLTRFCSRSCSAKWRVRQPEFIGAMKKPEVRKKLSISAKKRMEDITLRKKHSERMKKNNPMHNPETRAKMTQSKMGQPISERGGNGQFSIPQLTLLNALGLSEDCLEYVVKTREIRHLFPTAAYCYKIDIAIIEHKIAIEIDGYSHQSLKIKEKDKKKTDILTMLGWRVIRFWNWEIQDRMQDVIERINSFMILK